MDSILSIKNSSGKTFSLLNDNNSSDSDTTTYITPYKVNKLTSSLTTPVTPKRKYHCVEPGCNKSFTTSGHLARHNRIHTGEKNFHCLYPGCPSRFSRQDNMMQHYRTHLSQKSRRPNVKQPKKNKELPQLFCYSYHEREDNVSHQPLVVTRPRRSITMPSLPYPNLSIDHHHSHSINSRSRPKRTLSTSSTCSTLSSPSSASSHSYFYQKQKFVLPPPKPSVLEHHQHHIVGNQSQHNQTNNQNLEWNSNKKQDSLDSSLLHLANIVSTFG